MCTKITPIVLIGLICNISLAQTAGYGFTLATINTSGEGNVGNQSHILAIYAGSDLDNDSNGEIIFVDAPASSNSEMVILEATGTNNTYTVVWRTDLHGRMSKRCGLNVGDTDGDGKQEIIVGISAGATKDSVFIFEVDGSAPIADNSNPDETPTFSFTTLADPRGIIIANLLTTNINPEIIVGNTNNTESIEFFESSSDNNWTKQAVSNNDIGQGIVDMAGPADLDGDGTKEIAICEERGALNVISLSGTTVQEETVDKNIAANVNSDGRVIIANLDQSGNPEIILCNDEDDALFIFESTSTDHYSSDANDGVNATAIINNVFIDDRLSITAGDYDNDDKWELYYTTNADTVRYREWNGTAAGDFNASSDFPSENDLIDSLGTGETATAIVYSPNKDGSTLLDGDTKADIAIGRTNGTGNEIYIVESKTTDSSLPVELSSWSVESKDGIVVLTWTTASEINNLGFVLYRGLAGKGLDRLVDFRRDARLRGQGSTTQSTHYQFIDRMVSLGQTYDYRLSHVSYDGVETFTDLRQVTVAYPSLSWETAHPNPFNATTEIKISVGEPRTITIKVYDLTGHEVARLINGHFPAGSYSITWDGNSEQGPSVASGLYIICLVAGNFRLDQKVLLLR